MAIVFFSRAPEADLVPSLAFHVAPVSSLAQLCWVTDTNRSFSDTTMFGGTRRSQGSHHGTQAEWIFSHSRRGGEASITSVSPPAPPPLTAICAPCLTRLCPFRLADACHPPPPSLCLDCTDPVRPERRSRLDSVDTFLVHRRGGAARGGDEGDCMRGGGWWGLSEGQKRFLK